MNTDILATDGTYSYIFDANGNLISRTDVSDPEQDSYWSYSYDPDNRLTKVERVVNGSLSKTITYWYDPMGNLIKRSCTIGSQTTTTDYTVDIAQGLPVVLIEQRSGGETLLYTYGEDLLKVSKDGDYYYFYDGLGSTRTITSGAAGTVVAEYLYDAYGAQLLTGQPAWNTRLFTGEPCDPDTGLIYLRARWYDPGTGRFVSRDTYEGSQDDPLSQHRYLYCSDDPVNRVDPSGEYGTLTGVCVGMAIATALIGSAYNTYFDTWKQVGDVFKGYGDNLNPIKAYRGILALYTLSKAEGISAAGTGLLIGIVGTYKNWLVTDNPRDLANRSGLFLLLLLRWRFLLLVQRKEELPQQVCPQLTRLPFVLANQGVSRGARFTPKNLSEQLSMREVLSDPSKGKVLRDVPMTDPRWPASEGWQKMQYTHQVARY